MTQINVAASIILAGIFSALGGAIFARHPKARLNRVFAFLCAIMAVMSLAQAMLGIARNIAEAAVWMKTGMAIWPFSMSVMFVFSLVYTKAQAILRHKALIAVFYLPSLALSALILSMPLPVDISFGGTWQYSNRPPMDSTIILVSAAWGAALNLATLILLVRHQRRMKERLARKQAAFVTLGIMIPVLTGILTQGVLPSLGIRVPAFADVSGAGLALFVGFAMWRYELFVIDPAQAADRILSVIREAVLLLDPEKTVIYANPAACRFWERPQHGLIGRSVAEVCGPGFTEAGGMEKLLGGEHESAMEVSWKAADGSTVSALMSGAFLMDRLGGVKGAVLVTTDISGQKRLEHMLNNNRQMLRDLVDNSQAKIILVDPHGVILAANEPVARHFDHTTSSLLGRNVFALFPAAVVREREEKLARVVATGVPLQYEEVRGGRHWEHRITPVMDDEQRVTAVTVFSIDITERVEAERMKERLIGDLRDALAKVKTLTGLIPICSRCKRIRNDSGYWEQVEQYMAEHTGADFTHGLCPDCVRKLYPPDVADKVLGSDSGSKKP